MFEFTDEQITEAIKGSGGIMSTIADRMGVSWYTAQKFVQRNEVTKQAYEDEKETMLDMVESKAIDAIRANDAQMIRYYLSTKGKKRGFTEKQEIEHSGTQKIIYLDKDDERL